MGTASGPSPALPGAAGVAPLRPSQARPAAAPRGERGSFARALAAAMEASPAGPFPEAGAGPLAGPSLAVDLPEGPIPQGASSLDWAARELESVLWAHWLQEALNPPEGGWFGQGFAASVYGDWLARALAEELVLDGPSVLSRMLVAQLSGSQNREKEIP